MALTRTGLNHSVHLTETGRVALREVSMRYRLWLALLVLLFGPATAQGLQMNGFSLADSLVPANEIFRGGPPRDGIPAIDNPVFESAEVADQWLDDRDIVLGVHLDGEARAYPARVLVWHEIVNDRLADTPLSVTYCPLCGSGVVFDRRLGERLLDFGVSGLLHNSDLLLYDRQTESLWSQIPGKAISGELRGETLTRLPVTHTAWSVWREQHPDTQVLSRETGHERDYARDPYVDYDRSYSLLFPVEERDRRYHPKELVIGLEENGQARVWPFAELRETDGILEDDFFGKPVLVRYDDEFQAAAVFDEQGEQLPAVTAFWFAWFAFYPFTEVYEYHSE